MCAISCVISYRAYSGLRTWLGTHNRKHTCSCSTATVLVQYVITAVLHTYCSSGHLLLFFLPSVRGQLVRRVVHRSACHVIEARERKRRWCCGAPIEVVIVVEVVRSRGLSPRFPVTLENHPHTFLATHSGRHQTHIRVGQFSVYNTPIYLSIKVHQTFTRLWASTMS